MRRARSSGLSGQNTPMRCSRETGGESQIDQQREMTPPRRNTVVLTTYDLTGYGEPSDLPVARIADMVAEDALLTPHYVEGHRGPAAVWSTGRRRGRR